MVGKQIETVKLVCSRRRRRRRSPASTCWSAWALQRENILVTDSKGVLTREPDSIPGRAEGALRARHHGRTLADIVDGADVFLGLSAGVLKPEMVGAHGRAAR